MGERGDGGIRPEAILAVLLIVSILMMVFIRVLNSSDIRNRGVQFVFGIQRAAGKAVEQVKDSFGSLRRLHDLRQEHEALLETLGGYQGIEREVLELRRENEVLKKQLGFSASLKYEHIPARVIAGDPSNLFATITLDKGTQDEVKAGMTVTAFQGGFFGLLGKVVAVGTQSCQVRPLINPDHYVAARLAKTRFEGLVSGREAEGGELIMKYVPKSSGGAIAINDLIVTSGMESIYPPGIYIGRIKEIRSREYTTSLEIIVHPIVDRKRIEYVSILRGER